MVLYLSETHLYCATSVFVSFCSISCILTLAVVSSLVFLLSLLLILMDNLLKRELGSRKLNVHFCFVFFSKHAKSC